MRVRRLLSAATLAVLAAGGLTACQNRISLAASVNDTQLSVAGVQDYVQNGAKPYTDQSGETVVPQSFAVQAWVRTEVIDSAVDAHGGPRTTAESAAARTAALSGSSLSAVETSFEGQGYTAGLADLVVDQNVALVVLVERLLGHNATAAQAVAALQSSKITTAILISAINSGRPTVTVSPRYGTWRPAQFALVGGGKGSTGTVAPPSFIHYDTANVGF